MSSRWRAPCTHFKLRFRTVRAPISIVTRSVSEANEDLFFSSSTTRLGRPMWQVSLANTSGYDLANALDYDGDVLEKMADRFEQYATSQLVLRGTGGPAARGTRDPSSLCVVVRRGQRLRPSRFPITNGPTTANIATAYADDENSSSRDSPSTCSSVDRPDADSQTIHH